MKKIMLFAAACLALAACSKDIDTTSPEIGDGSAFEKGQKVTLTVKTGDQTKVSSELETSGADKDKINFKWQSGDIIKVTVGTKSAEFTLSSGAGEATAEFTGTMPAAGDNFDVQYPSTEPDLATQAYSATEALPHDKMKMAATGCTLGNSFTLTPQNAALRLNLYGIERKVSQIIVTDMTSTASPKPSYTLSISPAITVSGDKNTPTPFFIVVPAGTSAWNFKTEVTSEAVTPSTYVLPKYPSNTEPDYGSGILVANGSFTTTSAKTFTAGEILNMAAVPLTTVWAPVNCGYDSDHTYGLLYQWGRIDGGTYDKEVIMPPFHDAETQTQTAVTATWDVNGYNKNPKSNEFYKNGSQFDWYTNDVSKQLTEWPMTAPEGTSGIGNPCPEGWRVPTYNELNALVGGNSSPESTEVEDQKGCYFNGTSSASSGVFLPKTGRRHFYDGCAGDRNDFGYYWSSSVSTTDAWILSFEIDYASVTSVCRAYGQSVRCVQE